MKIRILFFCGIILALCLWLLLHRAVQTKSDSREAQAALTNQQSASQPTQPLNREMRQGTSAPNASLAKMSPQETPDARSQQALAPWYTPIAFYGKIIDENSNPVAGVTIQFRWATQTEDIAATTSATESDTEGLFSLRGKRGRSLEVSVSKEGYYNSRKDKTGFLYALGSDIYSPDPLNPVIFNLRKKGTPESLIHIAGIGLHSMRDFLLAADGKATEVSLRDGRLTPAGQGDLKVEFQAGPPLENFPSRISWQCQVSVPGGGLVQTSEEFPFLAPENGYQEFDQWSITSTNWTETLDKQYYLKLRDGNFGRVKLRVIGVPNRAFFRMESFLNPLGSRNLEPQ